MGAGASKKVNFNLPIQLVLIVLICLFFGKHINDDVKSFLYATSLSIKEVLIFFLPYIIFAYILSCIISFQDGKGSFVFVLLLLILVCLSNFLSTLVAYVASNVTIEKINALKKIKHMTTGSLKPMWSFSLPKLVSNDFALFSGLILGCIFSFKQVNSVNRITSYLRFAADYFLNKLFIPLVPIFILGFILKLEEDGIFSKILRSYGPIFLLIFSVQLIYLIFLYAVGSKTKFKVWKTYIRNMIPAAVTAFSTMSSAATIPVNIKATEQNTKDPALTKAVIPATVSIHLVGDSIGIPIMAMAILATFNMPFPDMTTYLIFAVYFVLAKFAVAAVPGGGIIVMLPVMQQYLGFTPEMLSLITAIYIMLDPIVTMVNVLGNGAFAIIFTKIFKKVRGEAPKQVL
jgi:Na+/H+-dicarboxylate symporter